MRTVDVDGSPDGVLMTNNTLICGLWNVREIGTSWFEFKDDSWTRLGSQKASEICDTN